MSAPSTAFAQAILIPGHSRPTMPDWAPQLLLRAQRLPDAAGDRHVLYVHGATFPSASSLMFRFDGTSWADELNHGGFSAWALDFAGYGGSERYPEMERPAPPPGAPLGRCDAAAVQIGRAVRRILAETAATKVHIIAHSWGTIATGAFAGAHADLVGRIVFFGPIARREGTSGAPPLSTWRFLTVEEQWKRFVGDVPPGHPPVLLPRRFEAWASIYLDSDTSSRTRVPPAVRTPNGPIADIADSWSGRLPYDPARIRSPVGIIRGEWDSLCRDEDAAWLRAALASSPVTKDVTIRRATHLMHLEEGRGELHRASIAFLEGR